MKRSNSIDKKVSPSLSDVAKRAGVSPASVSRVLNGIQPISERLRVSVEEAARELGYTPRNPKALRGSSALAIFINDLQNPVFTEILTGIEDRAAAHAVNCILMDLRGGRSAVEQVKSFLAGPCSLGFIVLGTALNERALLDLSSHGKIPLVIVNHVIRNPAIRSINIDFVKATYGAAVHLLNLRHRRFVFLGGSASSLVTQEKISGVRNALRDAGLELAAGNIYSGQSTIDWGFQAMKSLLTLPGGDLPTAVVCSCDLIALGVLHAIRSSGYSVPQDISVVGFDDIAMACHSSPALTTISPPKYKMGGLAVDLLLPHGADPSPITDYVMMESPLVVRESTAVCADSTGNRSRIY